MKTKYLEYLSDPVDLSRFRVDRVFKKIGEEIIDALLFSEEDWYPIIEGIPRLLVGELKADLLRNHYDFYRRYLKVLPKKVKTEWQNEINKIENMDKFLKHQKITGESFAYEWKNIYRENSFERKNCIHFMSPFIKEEDFANKCIIDIGCGSGRFSKWPAKLGAKVVFGVDLGESVEVAYKMTKKLDNVCIVQADIYHMPFINKFDIAYSIGVLHHLPKPKEGFLALPRMLKKGGKMLIWVYNRRNNNRALYFYEPIRYICRFIPKSWLNKLSYIPAVAVHLINLVTIGLGKVGLIKLSEKVPFFYYANFPFNMKLNDSFDVLATPKSNYYRREEIKEWFKEAKLKDIDTFEHLESGITGVGTV
jgi:2-polyprenyl-3-methyl-5-hydroxy-6-metoxy-1,4-benzoquinol methylase/uncharacterized protein YbaR (Trm112 family)